MGWNKDDDLWLCVPDTADPSPLRTALGIDLLRITATEKDKEEQDRDGYIDVRILSFDRSHQLMHVAAVENTSGNRLSSQRLVLGLDIDITAEAELDMCPIKQIEGIEF